LGGKKYGPDDTVRLRPCSQTHDCGTRSLSTPSIQQPNNGCPNSFYAIFAYLWKFVMALDQVPQLVQQVAKLRDLDRRVGR